MLTSFFRLAARSPSRQRTLLRAMIAHIVVLVGLAFLLPLTPARGTPTTLLGQFLLVAGIVEGALLVGWRLTQMPKSQALEFLLVSPVPPFGVLIAEALVGFTLLTLVSLAGLPVLIVLATRELLTPLDVATFLTLPLTWGALTGILLTAWAYEPRWIRKIGEKVLIVLVLVYLVCGVLAGEKLQLWLQRLPESIGVPMFHALVAFRDYNPFGAMRCWTEQGPEGGLLPIVGVELGSLLVLGLLLIRAACRLQPHFHELHYQPVQARAVNERHRIGNRPLTWWAVKRVSEYSGQINLWLAGGFGLLYGLYSVAGPVWPDWMGRGVFALCDRFLGLGGLATALIVLAAVPAAFQYGLWDASVQDRLKRLELLLLTRLRPTDYWHAAARAAWSRGQGYFVVATLLLQSAVMAKQISARQAIASLSAGVLLWTFYFALGFRSFARGVHANGLGVLLTVGLPLAVAGLFQVGLPQLASLLPPGAVYAPTRLTGLSWVVGPVVLAVLTLWLARGTLATCDAQLRRWYDLHCGLKVTG